MRTFARCLTPLAREGTSNLAEANRLASSFLSRPKIPPTNTTTNSIAFKPLISSTQGLGATITPSAAASSDPQPRRQTRRRTFARPTFAESTEEAPVEASVPAVYSNASGAVPAKASAAAGETEPGALPATSADIEGAILDMLDKDAKTSTSIAARVSRQGRFDAAHAERLVTADDPVLSIMDLPIVDEEEREVRQAKDQATRERIRVEGTTGTGLGTSGSSVTNNVTLSDTISLTKNQIDAEREEMEAAAPSSVSLSQLSREQKHLLWTDRKETYSVVHRKILIALESHHSEMDKTLLLMELHDVLIKQRLRLRAEVYVDILATAFSALTGPEHYTSNNRNRITLLDELWVMYQYCIDSGSDPLPKLIQNMMRILSLCRKADMNVETKAHRLMLDSDRFKLIPTNMCLSTYFVVCGINNAMHLAVARYVDSKSRFEVIPTADMITNIIDGFRKNGRNDDGIRFLATVSNLPVTSPLLSVIIHTARGSSNPLSAFTFYKALRQTDMKPDGRVINSLLQAQETANDYSNSKFILSEMMRHRVRLETDPLNRMLIALERAGLHTEFGKLFVTMRRHGKTIYLERFGPEALKVATDLENRMREGEESRKLRSSKIASSPSRVSRAETMRWKEPEAGGPLKVADIDRPSLTERARWRSSHGVANRR